MAFPQSPANVGAAPADPTDARTEGRDPPSTERGSPHPTGVRPRRPRRSQREIWGKPLAFRRGPDCGRMTAGESGVVHGQSDLRGHLVWIPEHQGAVFVGQEVLRDCDLLRQIAMEHEVEILKEKVTRDHLHPSISTRSQQSIRMIVQRQEGVGSRMLLGKLAHLRRQPWSHPLRRRAASRPPPALSRVQ
jgi:REP element-mobilizing transposase RayT